jgi:hypothetical protein
VLSVPQPVQVAQQYALQTQYPGVAGWAAFGRGAIERVCFIGRFSTPAQSFLVAKAALAVSAPPVSRLGKLDSDSSLIGLVQLTGSDPIDG